MELLKRILGGKNQPANPVEQRNTTFLSDLESSKELLKKYGLSYYETTDGDNKATGSKSIGDLTNKKEKAFQQQLAMMIESYPNRIDELRGEIIRISQDAESTGIRDKDRLTHFAGEIINLFPPQSDKYSDLKK